MSPLLVGQNHLCYIFAMQNETSLSNERVASLRELGEAFRGIHNRLISEGWNIKNGIFTPHPGYQLPKQPRSCKRKNLK